MDKAVPGADNATFAVLKPNFECTAEATRAYYEDTQLADAEPKSFRPGKVATGCSATSITFAE